MKRTLYHHRWARAAVALAGTGAALFLAISPVQSSVKPQFLISPPVVFEEDVVEREIGLRAFNGSASPVHVVLTLLESGQAKSGPSDNPNDPGSKARVARQEEFLLQPGQAAEVTIPCDAFPSGQVVGAVGEVKGDLSGVSAALQVTETNTLDHKVFAYVPMQMGVGILPPQ